MTELAGLHGIFVGVDCNGPASSTKSSVSRSVDLSGSTSCGAHWICIRIVPNGTLHAHHCKAHCVHPHSDRALHLYAHSEGTLRNKATACISIHYFHSHTHIGCSQSIVVAFSPPCHSVLTSTAYYNAPYMQNNTLHPLTHAQWMLVYVHHLATAYSRAAPRLGL